MFPSTDSLGVSAVNENVCVRDDNKGSQTEAFPMKRKSVGERGQARVLSHGGALPFFFPDGFINRAHMSQEFSLTKG